MNKIYEEYKDLHVKAICVYVKTGDAYAYADSAKTVKIDSATMKEMFEKGTIIVDGALEYKPVSFGVALSVGTLTYVKTDGTTPTTAVLATLKSSEYTAG
jgi:tetrahydromethanopterin S-methyltransferase subunit D